MSVVVNQEMRSKGNTTPCASRQSISLFPFIFFLARRDTVVMPSYARPLVLTDLAAYSVVAPLLLKTGNPSTLWALFQHRHRHSQASSFGLDVPRIDGFPNHHTKRQNMKQDSIIETKIYDKSFYEPEP